MVKVYFETTSTAELVAVFDNEETYERCFPALERFANEIGMFITESIEDESALTNMKERCVLCGAITPYDRETPIDERLHYVEGCGQFCKNCY